MASLKAGVMVITRGTCPGVYVLPSKADCDKIALETLRLSPEKVANLVYKYKVLTHNRYQHAILTMCDRETDDHVWSFNMTLMRPTQASQQSFKDKIPTKMVARWTSSNRLPIYERLASVFSSYRDLYKANEHDIDMDTALPHVYGIYEATDGTKRDEWRVYDILRRQFTEI